MKLSDRRDFLIRMSALSAVATMPARGRLLAKTVRGLKFGIVTYQWGRDWDLKTLIRNCELAGLSGVELRTQHAHKVEPDLTPDQRREVKKRFEDSPLTCVGYGSNQEYHSPDLAVLEQNIQVTFDLIKLCHDIGASGVKVKPNTLPADVPREKTIEQIGKSLDRVGKYAADYGQKIRVEVHGRITSEIPVMKAIFDHVRQPNVGACWNSNDVDLQGAGLEANFQLLRSRFADTVHVRELDDTSYPYQRLFDLLVGSRYEGWILLEARTEPADRVAALKQQLALFEEMAGKA